MTTIAQASESIAYARVYNIMYCNCNIFFKMFYIKNTYLEGPQKLYACNFFFFFKSIQTDFLGRRNSNIYMYIYCKNKIWGERRGRVIRDLLHTYSCFHNKFHNYLVGSRPIQGNTGTDKTGLTAPPRPAQGSIKGFQHGGQRQIFSADIGPVRPSTLRCAHRRRPNQPEHGLYIC